MPGTVRSPNRATPAVLGPINPPLPNYKRNKKGDLILQKWGDHTKSPTGRPLANRENISRVKVEVRSISRRHVNVLINAFTHANFSAQIIFYVIFNIQYQYV